MAEEGSSLFCAINCEMTINAQDAMQMLKYINACIETYNERGEAPTLDKFSWMMVGKCKFANSGAAVETQRVMLLYKLEQMPQYPKSRSSKEVVDFMIYLQELISTLDEQRNENTKVNEPKLQKAKMARKKRVARRAKRPSKVSDVVEPLNLSSTRCPTPDSERSLQMEQEKVESIEQPAAETSKIYHPEVRKSAKGEVAFYPPKASNRIRDPAEFAVASATFLPWDEEFGSDMFLPFKFKLQPSKLNFGSPALKFKCNRTIENQ